MKYSESPRQNKKAVNIGLYVIIALCLLIVGGAAWFAISANTDGKNDTPKDSNPDSSIDNWDDLSEYTDPNSSYNESVMEPPLTSSGNGSAPTADSVSSEPYSSKSETASKPKNEPETIVFTMPINGEIIKKHSDTELQFSSTYSDMRIHKGIDIKGKIGTFVSACSDGVIESITPNTTLGNVVVIDHKNGITVKYASLDNLKFKVGDSVKAGDIIGTIGSIPAECMDGEHLHLEVLKNGKSVEPLKALGLE